MAKRTVLIAVTVDEKYSVNEVAKEVNYLLPFITSECLDTVVSVYPARIKEQRSYTVWSSSKAEGADTYDELLAYETCNHGSVSSVIVTNDIAHILEAIYNETDIELKFHPMESA